MYGVFVITALTEIWACPDNTVIPLIRPFFFYSSVTGLTGFHCSKHAWSGDKNQRLCTVVSSVDAQAGYPSIMNGWGVRYERSKGGWNGKCHPLQ